jgi:putative nucleotidyltransferase with HDIG domain
VLHERVLRKERDRPTSNAPTPPAAKLQNARSVAELTRRELDQILVGVDPAGDLRRRLADGSLDVLIPEIRREMDVPQRTHYHHLSVLEHSLETMARMPPRLDERLAGLFHDIGKRRTTTIKERTGEEQYIGHAGASATMARDSGATRL